MINGLKLKYKQGTQYIKDLRKAQVHELYRGFPQVDGAHCDGCGKCTKVCRSAALTVSPLSIDMGKCTFCGDCVRACPTNCLAFTNFHKTAAVTRNDLVIETGTKIKTIEKRNDLRKLFGRSLKLRQVSAGGCNACELELNASGNVNFDMGRYGIEFVASPRHADGLVITGPIPENMAPALEDTYRAIPDPKLVIVVGTCAISGGVFAGSPALKRNFLDEHPVDLYIPGCPPHPLTIINGIMDLLGIA